MNFTTTRTCVLEAIAGVFADEPELLPADTQPCEQAFQFQFARRVALTVEGHRHYAVDCEYRRAGNAVKGFPLHPVQDEERRKSIVPDVIIHQRNPVAPVPPNLLAVEIKPYRRCHTRWFNTHDDLKLLLLCGQIQPEAVTVGPNGYLIPRQNGDVEYLLEPNLPEDLWQYRYGLFLLVAHDGVRLDWYGNQMNPGHFYETFTAQHLRNPNGFPGGPGWP